QGAARGPGRGQAHAPAGAHARGTAGAARRAPGRARRRSARGRQARGGGAVLQRVRRRARHGPRGDNARARSARAGSGGDGTRAARGDRAGARGPRGLGLAEHALAERRGEGTARVTKREKQRTLWPSEVAVSDVIGRLIEFWGFKRNMGRVWTVLYLSPEPLSAEDLCHALKLSTGAVSMTLSELARWGVVRKVWIQGERKDFYTAEVQLWRMISRVFNEREKSEVISAIDAFEEALRQVDRIRKTSTDAPTRARAELQHERIAQLLEL